MKKQFTIFEITTEFPDGTYNSIEALHEWATVDTESEAMELIKKALQNAKDSKISAPRLTILPEFQLI